MSWGTLVVLAITYLTGERIARLVFEHEVRRSFVMQKRAALDLICLGSVADGVRWFGENLEGLTRVENTVFTRGDNSHIIDQTTWNRHLKVIQQAIGSNCVWTDIATPAHIPDLQKFRDALPAADRRRYNLYSLDVQAPILQCMTLRYSDGTTKVLFGWDFASQTCKSDFVFLGEGEQIGNYFGQYMTGLEHVSAKITLPPLQQQPPAPAPVTRQATVPPEQ